MPFENRYVYFYAQLLHSKNTVESTDIKKVMQKVSSHLYYIRHTVS